MLHESWEWFNERFPQLDVPDPEEVGMEHRRLKATAVRYFLESVKLKPNEIYVEVSFSRMKPDVYDAHNNIVYDAKTSRGRTPSEEIYDLTKYYGLYPKEIRAVMRPLPLILDIESVVNRLKALPRMGVYVPMLDDGFRLVGLDELFRIMDEKYNGFLSYK